MHAAGPEGVKLLAVASGSRERAEAFAAEFKVEKVCGSYEELLALPEIDAVYISVINSLHYETARKCLEAGKAVLCEKPFCVTVSQTEELIRLARRKRPSFNGRYVDTFPSLCLRGA